MSYSYQNPRASNYIATDDISTLQFRRSSRRGSEIKTNKNNVLSTSQQNLLEVINLSQLNQDTEDDTEIIEAEEYYAPEGIHGWIIVFAAFCTNFVVDGISLSYGVMTEEITAKMMEANASSNSSDSSSQGSSSMSIAEFNTVASVLLAITLIMGPVASVIAEKIGFRKAAMIGSVIATCGIFISWALSPNQPAFLPFLFGFGILTGIGFGILFTVSIVIVGLYFKKNRALATGITVAGSGVGTLTLAPVMNLILTSGGWQCAILFQTALCAVSFVFAFAYRPIPKRVVKVKKVDMKQGDIPIKQQLKELLVSPSYLILAFSGSLIMMGYFAPFGFLDRAAEIIGRDDAVNLLIYLGVFNAVGRVIFGFLANQMGHALLISNISLTVGGLVTILYPFANTHELIILCSIVFGTYSAVFASMRSIVIIEIIQEDKFNVGFGLSLIFMGIATLFSNSLGGILKEKTENYDMSFYVAGAFLIAGSIICYPLSCIIRCEKGVDDEDSCRKSSYHVANQRKSLTDIQSNK